MICLFAFAQATECGLCPAGKTAPPNAVGLEDCRECGEDMVTDLTTGRCVCNVGYYSNASAPATTDNDNDNVNNRTDPLSSGVVYQYMACLPCPVGGDCSQMGTEASSLTALSGYYFDQQSFLLHKCLNPSYCLGGQVPCAVYREGPLCGLCQEGYGEATFGPGCVECPPEATSFVVVVVSLLAVLVCLGLMMMSVLR